MTIKLRPRPSTHRTPGPPVPHDSLPPEPPRQTPPDGGSPGTGSPGNGSPGNGSPGNGSTSPPPVGTGGSGGSGGGGSGGGGGGGGDDDGGRGDGGARDDGGTELGRAFLSDDDSDGPDDGRMWPLDLALVSLAGLVIGMVATTLTFDDPRPTHNAWTYIVAVPVLTIGVSMMLRYIASQYVRKSLQLGILFSTFVHLLLLVVAIRWVIFPHYFPEAFAGVKPDRSPIRKTIPEYLFQKPDESNSVTPDWSQPLDAETASRVVPQEERQLPPVKRSAPRLEIPKPAEPQPPQPAQSLMRRAERETSKPQPADAPSKLARRRSPADASDQPKPSAPEAPAIEPAAATTAAAPVQRSPDAQERSRPATTSAAVAMSASAPDLPPVPEEVTPTPSRLLSEAMPSVGSLGTTRQRSQRQRTDRPAPAGSSPAPPTVAIAKLDVDAERMLTPVESPLQRQADAPGAQLAVAPSDSPATSIQVSGDPGAGDLPERSQIASLAGMPSMSGDALQPRRSNRRRGASPSGVTGADIAAGAMPELGAIGEMMADTVRPGMAESVDPGESDQRLDLDRKSRTDDASRSAELSPAADLLMDMEAPDGPAGLAKEMADRAGIVPSTEPVEMASMDLARDTRVRKDIGGPITPAGLSVAAVESFSRRVQRTNGGAAPAPAGAVGPATEEAIELGLAYLASRQNANGSWSLQGHGEDVLLQSDTAATGLCLLAFQGAGYTHRQHQYAPVVARALEFLVENQRTNGDLYRRENALSDQNVAFYSHGIAALALCESYGMTQDPQLRGPAQQCLNYIEATQHRRRGGWRYTPQVSADTSVTGWMMMALKSGDLSGLTVSPDSYAGINRWLELAKVSPARRDLYRYNPFAPDTPSQGHGRKATPTMTAVGMLMRMYSGWRRDNPDMQSAADYILKYPPSTGTRRSPQRDTYYWYYATQVMFHMGGDYWDRWNSYLNPILIESQIKRGPEAGSWDPELPVPDRWSPHGGRMYVTTMNLLNLEVYYRHLPIYEETGSPE